MRRKRDFFIIGTNNCPACGRALSEALAARKEDKHVKFRFVNVSNHPKGPFAELVKEKKAVPIYLFPDGDVHIGVISKSILLEKNRDY